MVKVFAVTNKIAIANMLKMHLMVLGLRFLKMVVQVSGLKRGS